MSKTAHKVPANLPVNASRIAGIVNGLAGITEPDRPYTRRAFTPLFLEGRAFLDRRFRAAGLETRIDAAGNLIGRRKGRFSKLPFAGGWTGGRDFAAPQGGTFQSRWAAERRSK